MPQAISEADRHRIRRWWAAQVSDAEIARRLGVWTTTVSRWRRILGLPPWYGTKLGLTHSPATRAKLREKCREQLAAAGVRSLCQLSREKRWERQRRELAARYGLPEELYPTQIRILLALAGGPMTLPALLVATGRAHRRERIAIHAFNYARVGGANYITDLVRRGLIVRVPTCRGAGRGSGAGPGLYMLTALAMQLLAQKKEAVDAHAHTG